jgi:glycosyltransferase involved in cell wall biosynthesis
MSSQPKASICIPSYNHARFLPETLESALAQTYPNIEIIVVDDGSTDDSLRIAEAYAARHPSRVKVYTHPGGRNRGISATVNLGLEKATGEYHSGLPSDDALHPEKIARQVAFLESHPEIGFVYSYARMMDAAGRDLPDQHGIDLSRDPHPVERMFEVNAIAGATVLARRELFLKASPHDERLVYSDWDFWTRLLSLARVGFIGGEPLVRYRIHGHNTGAGVRHDIHLGHTLAVMEALREKAPRTGGELNTPRARARLDERIEGLRRELHGLYLHEYHLAAQAGRMRAALPLLWRATRLAPREVMRPRRLAAELKNGLYGLLFKSKDSAGRSK